MERLDSLWKFDLTQEIDCTHTYICIYEYNCFMRASSDDTVSLNHDHRLACHSRVAPTADPSGRSPHRHLQEVHLVLVPRGDKVDSFVSEAQDLSLRRAVLVVHNLAAVVDIRILAEGLAVNMDLMEVVDHVPVVVAEEKKFARIDVAVLVLGLVMVLLAEEGIPTAEEEDDRIPGDLEDRLEKIVVQYRNVDYPPASHSEL